MSISGIVSFAQIPFRLTELLIEPFKNINWYWLQIVLSFFGCVISIMYLVPSYYEKCEDCYYHFVKCCCLCCNSENNKNEKRNNENIQVINDNN